MIGPEPVSVVGVKPGFTGLAGVEEGGLPPMGAGRSWQDWQVKGAAMTSLAQMWLVWQFGPANCLASLANLAG
jgi:hypothetical protein